jgi:hypothetical protein
MMPPSEEYALKDADRYLSLHVGTGGKMEVSVSDLKNMANVLKCTHADARRTYDRWCLWALMFSVVHFVVFVLAAIEMRGRLKRRRNIPSVQDDQVPSAG